MRHNMDHRYSSFEKPVYSKVFVAVVVAAAADVVVVVVVVDVVEAKQMD